MLDSTEEKAKFGLNHTKEIQLLLAHLNDLVHERICKKLNLCCYSRYIDKIMRRKSLITDIYAVSAKPTIVFFHSAV